MMKLFVIILILMMSLSCTNNSSSEVETADLPLSMSLAPAFSAGFDVSSVKVTITKDDFMNSIYLDIVDETASGTFIGLNPGVYQIYVEVYEESDLIATGTGEGEVIAGETTTVQITIEPFIGNLEIVIDWGDFISEPPTRVLFIGNSITYSNGGVELHTMNLALSAYPEIDTDFSSITSGGATLEMHYNTSSTLEAINEGEWDYVVLQEQTPRACDSPELFYEYAIRLDGEITDAGAETAFFFSWNYEYAPEMLEFLSASYNHIGNELDAPVIPVGRAFQISLDQNPLIDLYSVDGVHPTHNGTYLAACTFFAYFWNENPLGLEYVSDESIDAITRDCLQEAAFQTYQMYDW